jgi:Cu(I)/Ag(I) efflux system membrane protein CusA/SilA
VEGRERYPVSVRYMRDFRDDIDSLGSVLVSSPDGKEQIPLASLASVRFTNGPAMIRDEDGLLTGYVYVDLNGRDPWSFMREADSRIRPAIQLPPGYGISWSGQYEAMERASHRLSIVVPVTIGLIALLILLNTRSLTRTFIVLLAVPFSAVGAFWLLYALGYNMSVAVWVGLIALLGVDAGTGVFMLLYLDLAYEAACVAGRLNSLGDLRRVICYGAAKRIRPKFMTTATMLLGLLPVMWAEGTGAEIMKRIAAPMIGGIVTSFLLELLIYPAVYEIWRWNFSLKKSAGASQETVNSDPLAEYASVVPR